MSWYSKEKPTPFDNRPIDGLQFLDGDVLANIFLREWTRGQKYPVIHFPSGFMASVQESSDPENVVIHLFGEIDLPYKQKRNDAYKHAREIATELGYVVKKRGKNQLELHGYDDDEHFILTYHTALHYIQDIEQIPQTEKIRPIHPAHILMNKEIAALLPPLYANEHTLGLDAPALIKYFHPSSQWTWYASEASAVMRGGGFKPLTEVALDDPRVEDVIFFGLVNGLEVELGTFFLSELKSIGQQGMSLPIERDLHYKPMTLKELGDMHRKERQGDISDNERPKLELDTLSEQAREVLLRDGYHAATLFVETSLQTLAVQIAELGETHEDREAQMFQAGLQVARMGDIGILQQVFLITEAWLSMVEANKPYIQPSKDPKRKEVLIITQLDVPENKMATRRYEMKRNKKGKLTQAIKQPQLEGESAESSLLTAFVLGFYGMTGKTND